MAVTTDGAEGQQPTATKSNRSLIQFESCMNCTHNVFNPKDSFACQKKSVYCSTIEFCVKLFNGSRTPIRTLLWLVSSLACYLVN